MLSDRGGVPLTVAVSSANTNDSLRRWVRDRGIKVRIARKGIESHDKLGKHHWVIERTMAWLTGYRRLTLRYERKATTSAPSSSSEPPSPATRNSGKTT
ncbi:hypothetical protein AB0878_46575 [Amycolatopsis sp. NPDC047767]|uniref:transposase n=1 Tax=Amycolatopsis sp. NPDC047767 TaxID=3156765 RepID=UPI003455FFC1